MSDAFLSSLKGQVTERLPFWVMRQAGRYLPEYRDIRKHVKDFLELCYTPELATEVTLQPIRRFGMDAAILFSDILVIPHALGQAVRFEQGEGPKLDPILSRGDIEKLNRPVDDTLMPVYETIRNVKKALPDQTALIGFSGAPWTLACYMIEGGGSKQFDVVRHFAYSQPSAFGLLIEKLTQSIIDYLSRQIENGVDVIQLFDSWAGVASPQQFEEWIIKPTTRITWTLKQKFPHIPIIGFPRMAGAKYAYYSQQTGVDAVSVDYQTPLAWARDLISLPLQGNLDPLLLATDIKATLAEVDRCVEVMHGKPFIFNLGHGVIQQTPVEHMQALADHIRSIRRS